MALLKILLILGIALFALVKISERFGKNQTPEQVNAISKWIFPLVLLSLVIQLIYMMVNN